MSRPRSDQLQVVKPAKEKGPSRERILNAAKALFAEAGYERTTTAEIAKRAGTSQSQIMNHFDSKFGILQAIFDKTWADINPALRLALAKIESRTEKLRTVMNIVLSYLERDEELRLIFLIEARRFRGEGSRIALVPGFIDFVMLLDRIIAEMVDTGELLPDLNPFAFRSALIGCVEGMLRDQVLGPQIPGSFKEMDMQRLFGVFLSACLRGKGNQTQTGS